MNYKSINFIIAIHFIKYFNNELQFFLVNIYYGICLFYIKLEISNQQTMKMSMLLFICTGAILVTLTLSQTKTLTKYALKQTIQMAWGNPAHHMYLNEDQNLWIFAQNTQYIRFFTRNSSNHFNHYFSYASSFGTAWGITMNAAGSLVVLGARNNIQILTGAPGSTYTLFDSWTAFPTRIVRGVALSQDTSILAAIAQNGILKIYTTIPGNLYSTASFVTFNLATQCLHMTMNSAGTIIAISTYDNVQTFRYNGGTWSTSQSLCSTSTYHQVDVTLDRTGSLLACGTGSQNRYTLVYRDLGTNLFDSAYQSLMPINAYGVSLKKDGSKFLAGNANGDEVYMYNIGSDGWFNSSDFVIFTDFQSPTNLNGFGSLRISNDSNLVFIGQIYRRKHYIFQYFSEYVPHCKQLYYRSPQDDYVCEVCQSNYQPSFDQLSCITYTCLSQNCQSCELAASMVQTCLQCKQGYSLQQNICISTSSSIQQSSIMLWKILIATAAGVLGIFLIIASIVLVCVLIYRNKRRNQNLVHPPPVQQRNIKATQQNLEIPNKDERDSISEIVLYNDNTVQYNRENKHVQN